MTDESDQLVDKALEHMRVAEVSLTEAKKHWAWYETKNVNTRSRAVYLTLSSLGYAFKHIELAGGALDEADKLEKD